MISQNLKHDLMELVAQVQDRGLDYSDCFCPNDKPEQIPNETLVDHLVANNVTIQKTGNWSLRCEPRISHLKEVDECFYLECSECHRLVWDINQSHALTGQWKKIIEKYPYCHCGAKMNGGYEDEK